jgi:hypothetical protein
MAAPNNTQKMLDELRAGKQIDANAAKAAVLDAIGNMNPMMRMLLKGILPQVKSAARQKGEADAAIQSIMQEIQGKL